MSIPLLKKNRWTDRKSMTQFQVLFRKSFLMCTMPDLTKHSKSAMIMEHWGATLVLQFFSFLCHLCSYLTTFIAVIRAEYTYSYSSMSYFFLSFNLAGMAGSWKRSRFSCLWAWGTSRYERADQWGKRSRQQSATRAWIRFLSPGMKWGVDISQIIRYNIGIL